VLSHYLVQLLGDMGRWHLFILLAFAWQCVFLLFTSRGGCCSRLHNEEAVIHQVKEQLEAASWKRRRCHANPEAPGLRGAWFRKP
jgi:hypothetical protein